MNGELVTQPFIFGFSFYELELVTNNFKVDMILHWLNIISGLKLLAMMYLNVSYLCYRLNSSICMIMQE